MRGKLLVKLLSAVVAAAMLLPLFYSVGLAEGQDNVVYDAGTTVEAENCTIHKAHGEAVKDPKANVGSAEGYSALNLQTAAGWEPLRPDRRYMDWHHCTIPCHRDRHLRGFYALLLIFNGK